MGPRTLLSLSIGLALNLPVCGSAQQSVSLGLSTDRVHVSGFYDRAHQYRSLVAEVALDPRNGVELTFGRFEATQTQQGWTPSDGEAPFKTGIRAHPIQLSYRRSFSKGDLPFQPVIRVGGDWVRLVDSYMSDTLPEKARASSVGVHVGTGLRVHPIEEFSISLEVEYRAFKNGDRKFPKAIDLSQGMGLRLVGLLRLGG